MGDIEEEKLEKKGGNMWGGKGGEEKGKIWRRKRWRRKEEKVEKKGGEYGGGKGGEERGEYGGGKGGEERGEYG